jgi:Mrp family chromosome partitioning ATPase
MASLLDELQQDADLLVLDSTPLLMVSDAFPLLERMSGVLLLARLDKTPGDAIRRDIQIARQAGGEILGIVATDARRNLARNYGYGYGYGYGSQGKGKGKGKGKGSAPAPAAEPVRPVDSAAYHPRDEAQLS